MAAVIIGRIVPHTQYKPPARKVFEAKVADGKNERALITIGVRMGHAGSIEKARALTGSKAKTVRGIQTAWAKYSITP